MKDEWFRTSGCVLSTGVAGFDSKNKGIAMFHKQQAEKATSFVPDGYARYVEILGDEYEKKKAALRTRLAQAMNEAERVAIQQAIYEAGADHQKKLAGARQNLY